MACDFASVCRPFWKCMLNKEEAWKVLDNENLENFNFRFISKFDLTNKGLMLIDDTKPLSQPMLPFY